MTVNNDYKRILDAWDNNVGQNDIYHMILYWINSYKSEIKCVEEIDDILERMNSNDETNDIVEDFIYGKYSGLRSEFNGN